ncbi:MAG: AAA family ATPase [bacterium]|nr:MAG: AAA family ATPase [bacterium]
MLRDYFPEGLPPDWTERGAVRRIMILGGTDTGKTTLVEALADRLSRSHPVGVVDLDVGQSTVGPPTTVAWTRITGGFPGRGVLHPEGIAFVGSLTPRGSFLPLMAGAVRMVNAAAAACPVVLIDTSGFIQGPEGQIFKQHKVDLLEPDFLVALQRTEELEPTLHAFRHQDRPVILRLNVSPAVRTRSAEERAAWRRERFADHFTGEGERVIHLSEAGLRVTRDMPDLSNFALRNRIVSLRDAHGKDLALGIILEVRRREGTLLIRTSLDPETPVSTVLIGETVSPL